MTLTSRNVGSEETLQGRQFSWITQDQTDERLHKKHSKAKQLSTTHPHKSCRKMGSVNKTFRSNKNHFCGGFLQRTLVIFTGNQMRKNKTASRIQNIVTEDYYRWLCLPKGLEGDTQIRTWTTWLVEFPTVNTSKRRHSKKKHIQLLSSTRRKRHFCGTSNTKLRCVLTCHFTQHPQTCRNTSRDRRRKESTDSLSLLREYSRILKGTKPKTQVSQKTCTSIIICSSACVILVVLLISTY